MKNVTYLGTAELQVSTLVFSKCVKGKADPVARIRAANTISAFDTGNMS